MVRRRRIGLVFLIDDSWIGGKYYLTNIVASLARLDMQRKPELVIFHKDETEFDAAVLEYPFLTMRQLNPKGSILSRIKSKVARILFGRSYLFSFRSGFVDFVFPCLAPNFKYSGRLEALRKVYWIPDFQHKYLPHFFSSDELERRESIYSQIANTQGQLVLSSLAALSDFKKWYPEHVVEPVVVRFATVLPQFDHLNAEILFQKYGLQSGYFIAPNQFWVHKNQIIILKAIEVLKSRNLPCTVVFTGREEDFRDSSYAINLKKYVQDQGLLPSVLFLGFIDRRDLLKLMQQAIAVIQPSLFEGWSTVVEDAKAIGTGVIVSDLEVHREQCGKGALYFDPRNAGDLANCMERALIKKPSPVLIDYEKEIARFAEEILDL